MPPLVNHPPTRIGSHLWFVPEGAVIGSDVVTAFWKPPVAAQTDPPTADPNWQNLGRIEASTPTPSSDQTKIYVPSPGHYTLADVLTNSTELAIPITFVDMNEITYTQLLFGAKAVAADGTFVPASGRGLIRGWCKFQQYFDDDRPAVVADFWGAITGQPFTADRNNYALQTQLQLLQSPLNSGISFFQPIVPPPSNP